MSEIKLLAGRTDSPLKVSHVSDLGRRYPGEMVTFFTRLDAPEAAANLTLKIMLPNELELKDYACLGQAHDLPLVRTDDQGCYLLWSIEQAQPGDRYEYQTQVCIKPMKSTALQPVIYLESRALASDGDKAALAEETATVAVSTKGKYLQYLPSLYDQDDFMGRFLMLFESFLSPLEAQTDKMHLYFDPKLTPPDFLPWLASWLDLELDERWPLDKRRRLIRWAIALHRSRGTRWGLGKYLEIYTGKKPEIVEHRAENLQLGPAARLGQGVALGRDNMPHTFTVNLQLPPIAAGRDEDERAFQDKVRRQTIESIIDTQKPGHTLYTLNVETLLSAEAEAQIEAVEEAPVEDPGAAIWFKLDD